MTCRCTQPREQKLIDICFQLVLTALDPKYIKKFGATQKAEWVTDQLKGCGFNTEPCGASWGLLINEDQKDIAKDPLRH